MGESTVYVLLNNTVFNSYNCRKHGKQRDVTAKEVSEDINPVSAGSSHVYCFNLYHCRKLKVSMRTRWNSSTVSETSS